jgi:hypothetical protein
MLDCSAVDTKKCTKCSETKAVSEFNRDAQARDGLRAWCRECSNTAQREREALSKAADPDYYRDKWALKAARAAGMPLEEFTERRSKPCDICNTAGDPLSPYKGHGTDILGWICRKCNRALGLFEHDPDCLDRALRMLRGHRGQQIGGAHSSASGSS